MSRASIVELEAVSTVARTRSFRGAAKELGMSPSALSHAISTLESRLAVRLFHRSTRSVALTDEGEAFVARVHPALQEIGAAIDDVHEASGEPRGTLRLVAPRAACELVGLPLALEMRRQHPAVTIDLVSDARLVDIVAEGFDAGIRWAETVPRDMISIACGRSDTNIAIVAAPSYLALRRAPQKPQDLAHHDCVRYRKASGTVRRWELRMNGREVQVEVDGGLVVDDEAFLLRAALDGAGLSYLSEAAARPYLATGQLVRVLEKYSPRFGGYRLFHPSGRLVRAPLRAFLAIVRTKRGKPIGK